MNDLRVVELTLDQLEWPFSNGDPYFELKSDNDSCHRTVYIDPAPGYGHDRAVIEDSLSKVSSSFPLDLPIRIFSLNREDVSRTSGNTSVTHAFDPDIQSHSRPNWASIVLSGKRIPPHPAMTRYLVAHEYGHAVEFVLTWRLTKSSDRTALRKQYANMRGIEYSSLYGCGHWHQNIGEIFANDFRILVARSETEFWPHADTARPENNPDLKSWWDRRVAENAEMQSAA